MKRLNLKERWRAFFSVIADPWNVLLLGAVGALLLGSVRAEVGTLTSVLVSILLTLASAVLGGRIAQHWASVAEVGVIAARGQSAVRSLKLLLRNVGALEARILCFLRKLNEVTESAELTRRNYEEAVEICKLLQEETLSSIENWIDLVPEADINTQIGVISQLKSSIDTKAREIDEVRTALESTKLEAATEHSERRRLQADLREKEGQLARLRAEVVQKQIDLRGLPAAIAEPMPQMTEEDIAQMVKNESDRYRWEGE